MKKQFGGDRRLIWDVVKKVQVRKSRTKKSPQGRKNPRGFFFLCAFSNKGDP